VEVLDSIATQNRNGGQTMSTSLRILHLEDNPADAMLVRDQLAQDELAADVRNVSCKDDFLQALSDETWDLILADYKLPDYNGLDALKVVRKRFPNLPFILMSGTIGEQAAIESLKAGATDYILKQKRERLPAAVRRAVAEAAERARREVAEEELRRSEKHYRLLFEGNPHPMWVFDLESLKILEVNEAATQHYGYSRDEFLRMTLHDLRVPDDKRMVVPVTLSTSKHRGLSGGTAAKTAAKWTWRSSGRPWPSAASSPP
jgi:CheY-like chemotaxis protein